MIPYEQNVIRYATENPDGRMPFRHGWDLLNKPEKKACYTGLKNLFGVENYESVRARISGDRRIKLSVSEAIRVAAYFYAKFGIDNPWGDGTE
ncbi:MAG: hypothetical protein LUE20_00120 [Oscillospiraceae bacterium]|nr:hypothetical protein [Oscillospiraceae bacterium]